MPKLDAQGRFCIPFNLREKTSIVPGEKVAFFYENERIFITSASDTALSEKDVVEYRKIDYKGRIILPSVVLEILEATKEDSLIVSLKNNTISIFKR